MIREQEIIQTLNNWHQNIDVQEKSVDESSFKYTRNKFSQLYLEKTGEFLNISKRVENICYKRIHYNLSSRYEFDEQLLNQYIDWCFENISFFIEKYGIFNLSNCAKYSLEWDQDLNKVEIKRKYNIDDMHKITVSDGIFDAFKKYGIPLASTKLMIEKHGREADVRSTILKKLNGLTKNQSDLGMLRNMLMATVDNAPYESFMMFGNYQKSLSELFSYFSNEPWCPDI